MRRKNYCKAGFPYNLKAVIVTQNKHCCSYDCYNPILPIPPIIPIIPIPPKPIRPKKITNTCFIVFLGVKIKSNTVTTILIG